MALVNWNDSLSVNVLQIDNQHKKLVSMINSLHEAMKQGKGKEVMGRILNGLITYTDTHFKLEEDYFAKFGYLDTANHKKEHAEFVDKVMEFKNGFDSGKLTVTVQVMTFLSKWIQTHIKGTDMKYSAFFNEKGLI